MEDEELLNDFLKKKYSPKQDSRLTDPGTISAVAGYNTGMGESQYDENFLPNLHSGEGDFNSPLNKYRAKRQTGWDQLGNAAIRLTNIIPEAVGSVASALDFEDYNNSNDEVGNWLTSLTESWKQKTNEEFPIYRETPGKTFDVSDSGWWVENGSSLVNSIGGFAIGGGVISKGLIGLSKFTKAQKLANIILGANKAEKVGIAAHNVVTSTMLNQSEAILEAADVYDVTYLETLAKLQATGEVDAEQKARQKAADAASVTVSTNRINIFLNLSSANLFLKAPKLTRNLLKRDNLKRNVKHGWLEGTQESAEEVINFVAGQRGKAYGRDESYKFNDLVKDITSPESAESAVFGFIGGIGQTIATTEGINRLSKTTDPETGETISIRDYNNKQYDNQQALIKEYEDNAQLTDVKSFTSQFEGISEKIKIQEAYKKALDDNNFEEAEKLAFLNVDLQAFHAFRNGTTENLIKLYDDLGKGEQKEGMESNYKEKAKEAITRIDNLEKIYNNTANKINSKELYLNRTENITLKDNLNNTENNLSKAKNNVNEVINNLTTHSKYNGLKNTTDIITDITDLPSIKDSNPDLYSRIVNSSEFEEYSFSEVFLSKAVKELEANNKEYREKSSEKYQENYKKEKLEANKAIKEELEKRRLEQEDIEAIRTKIKNATTDKQIDDITIPTTITSIDLDIEKANRKTELQAEKDLKDNVTKGKNNDFDQAKKKKALENEESLKYVQDNFNIEDQITIEPAFGLNSKYNDSSAIIKGITENGVELELEDGTKVTVSIEASRKVIYSNNANFSSEGGEDSDLQGPTLDNNSGERHEKRGDSRILSSDNKGGVLFGNTAALEFEQVPRDKVGEEKTIEVPTDKDDVLSPNQLAALQMFKDKDFTDIDFLIDHLPLSVKLSEGVLAPLATKSETSEPYNKIFNETTRHLRETIIKEIINNNVDISNITVPIAGQWNGQLQVTETVDELAIENPIAALYEFSGDMSKIESTDFYMVDDFGFLKNSEGKTFPTSKNKSNAKGEIYLLINMANGKKFPLKLNVARISDVQADTLFDIYKFLATDPLNNRELMINDLVDEKLKAKIKEVFAKEIELFAKNKKSIKRLTVGDIVDTMIYSSTNPKTQLRFVGDKLFVKDKVYSIEDLDKPEIKKEFIQNITNIANNPKRHQIRFKKKKMDTANDFHFENRSYVEYLLSNNILNTNAVITTPTFAGRTSIYLDTKGVKIDGVESKFNQEVPVYLSDTLLGTNTQLEKELPGLFKNPVQLNAEGTHYTSKNNPNQKYNRVSTLKGGKINPDDINVYNAAKRGEVVDELIRQFFSNPYFKKSEFVKQGIIQLININKVKPNTEVIMSDEFFGQLFNILETYKAEFEKNNWTVYSNSPALSGSIGEELFAGTGDLLVFDNTKKEWMFIDIKTSSKNRSEYYEGKDPYGYKKKDAIQQNAYRELFKQETGIEIKHLLILPLTATSEDPGVNSEYRKLTIGLTKNDKKLLVVDMSKDIYELTNKKRKSTKKVVKKVATDEFDTQVPDSFVSQFEEGDAPSNLLDLSAFGVELSSAKKAEPVKSPNVQTTKSTSTYYKLNKEQLIEAQKAFKGPVFEAVYKGKGYTITSGTYYIVNDKGQSVTNIDGILNIITAFNKTIPKNQWIDKEIVRKIWKSRLNVVPLQNTTIKPVATTVKIVNKPTIKQPVAPIIVKQVDTMNFEKLTKAQAEAIIMTLMEKVPARIKDIAKILENNKSSQEKVKMLYSMLENNAIAKNIIETKCKK